MSHEKTVTTKSWLNRLRVAIASFALAAAIVGGVSAAPAPDNTQSDETAARMTSGGGKSGPPIDSQSITWS